MVCGIVVANTDDAAETTVTFTDNTGNSILTVECNVNDSQEVATTWIAEDGLIVPQTAANTIVTIFWRPWV
jgi:hypothetical protein